MNLGNGIKIVHEKGVSNKKTIHWKQIFFGRLKHSFLGIVTKKENILFLNDNFFICSTPNNEDLNSKNCVRKKLSGMILLCLAKYISQVRSTMYKWGKKESLLLKMCKRDVMNVTNSHHGSTGKYYSFGNRAKYRIMEQSSVTQYIHKKIQTKN